MADVNVLVVFYSRYGKAEKLALAAGLGAIQTKANIRLRRVADMAAPETINADPAWKQNLARMNLDYVAPRPADPAWADVIIFASPGDSSAEVERYVASLQSIGLMQGKIAALLAVGNNESVLRPIYAAAACAGFIVAPVVMQSSSADAAAEARAYGQRVSVMARALKEFHGEDGQPV